MTVTGYAAEPEHPAPAVLEVVQAYRYALDLNTAHEQGLDNAPGIDFSKIPGTEMTSSRVARTALTNPGRRAHVIPGAANTIADLMARYLLPGSCSYGCTPRSSDEPSPGGTPGMSSCCRRAAPSAGMDYYQRRGPGRPRDIFVRESAAVSATSSTPNLSSC